MRKLNEKVIFDYTTDDDTLETPRSIRGKVESYIKDLDYLALRFRREVKVGDKNYRIKVYKRLKNKFDKYYFLAFNLLKMYVGIDLLYKNPHYIKMMEIEDTFTLVKTKHIRLHEKAKSPEQQRFFGMVWGVRQGEIERDEVSKEILDVVDSDMTDKDVKKMASTDHDEIEK